MVRPTKTDRPITPARMVNHFFLYLLFFIMAAIAVGCATSGQVQSLSPYDTEPAASLAHLPETRRIVVRKAVESIGADYAWGGSAPSTGFDCSGLVVYTHRAAGVATPRTAREMYSAGRSVATAIRPGDLVFFNSPEKKSRVHVGIFIGQGVFVHAPGRGKQVRRASLSTPYFNRYFIGARTFL